MQHEISNRWRQMLEFRAQAAETISRLYETQEGISPREFKRQRISMLVKPAFSYKGASAFIGKI